MYQNDMLKEGKDRIANLNFIDQFATDEEREIRFKNCVLRAKVFLMNIQDSLGKRSLPEPLIKFFEQLTHFGVFLPETYATKHD